MEKLKLDRNKLKNLATIFMVFDSIYFRFAGVPSIIHLLTRFVAPLFAWLMVDGFFHTHSRAKYCQRLWLAAILMQLGDVVSFALFQEMGISDNIFLTLAMSFSMIWLIDIAKENNGKKAILLRLAATIIGLVGMAVSEGGLTVIPFVLIAYLFYNQKISKPLFTHFIASCYSLLYTVDQNWQLNRALICFASIPIGWGSW